jgi:hypothetical protein
MPHPIIPQPNMVFAFLNVGKDTVERTALPPLDIYRNIPKAQFGGLKNNP